MHIELNEEQVARVISALELAADQGTSAKYDYLELQDEVIYQYGKNISEEE